MNPILQVLLKEIREIIRDKRVRSGATIMPIFVVAMMMTMFGFISKIAGKDSQRKIHVVANGNPLVAQLKQAKNLKIIEIRSEQEGIKLIEKGDARMVAVFSPPAATDRIVLRFDPKEDGSQLAKFAVVSALQPELAKRVGTVLAKADLNPADLQPIAFDDKPVVVGDGKGATGLIVVILPYLLVLFTFTGGVALASDLVAGEKERSTLETLLITPVTRTQIVLGKFFALCVVCVTAAISGLLGFAVASFMPMNSALFKDGLGITPIGLLQIFVILLPLAAAFAGLLLAASTYARNTREAQTYLSLLNLLVIVPGVFSQLIGLTEIGNAVWLPFVPILGAAAGMRAILLGKVTGLSVLGPVVVGLVLAGLCLWFAVRLFRREAVLLRV